MCAITVVALRRYVAESPADRSRRIDPPGLALGIVSLGALVAGFITAGQQGWTAPVTGALLGAGLLTALLFGWAEHRRQSPMLPLGLFRSPNLSAATVVGVLFNLCVYGTLICLSLFLQQTRHESALRTGLLILPMSVAVGAGALASGRLTARLGPRPPMFAGLGLAGAGAAMLATTGPGTSLGVLVGGSVLLGLCSLAMPAMTEVAVGAVGPGNAGLASGILNAARQSGGALGVALLGALLASSSGGRALTLPLSVAAAGYLVAIAATATIRVGPRPGQPRRAGRRGRPRRPGRAGQPR